MDRDIEKLMRKARGEKWWHALFRKTNGPGKIVKEKPIPDDAERYEVFIKTTYGENWRTGKYLIFFAGSGLIISLIVFGKNISSDAKLWMGSFFLLLPAYSALNLIRYRFFRTWRKRLPFELIGWEKLVNTNKLAEIFWRDNCSITVHMENPGELQKAFVHSALLIFAEEAKKDIYPAAADSATYSRRRKMFSVDGLTARGSANLSTISRIRKLCQKDLSMLSKKSGNVLSVKISVDAVVYAVMDNLPEPGSIQ